MPDPQPPAPVSDLIHASAVGVGFARTVATGRDRDRETLHCHRAPSSTNNSRTTAAVARVAPAAFGQRSQFRYCFQSQSTFFGFGNDPNWTLEHKESGQAAGRGRSDLAEVYPFGQRGRCLCAASRGGSPTVREGV